MEAQRATKPEKKMRTEADAGVLAGREKEEESPFNTPRDPIYPSQSPSSRPSHVGESIEGFAAHNTRDTGMSDLEKTEGFGARFQMPEPQTSDNFLNAPASAEVPAPRGQAEGALDIQATVDAIQDLVLRIRENLESPEQEELEELLRQGGEILSANWKQLSQFTTEQVSSVKSDLKENPYRGVIAALKIGMALSQIYSSRGEARVASPAAPSAE